MGAVDVVIAVSVLAAACGLLYRSLWKRGGCAGCSGGGCCSRERGRGAPEPLVKLGKERPGGR